MCKFGLDRNDILENSDKIPHAINDFARRLPTYVTIKDVKKRWGKGQVGSIVSAMTHDMCYLFAIHTDSFSYAMSQEDIHPVAQYEKLWGDMSSVEGMECSYFVVSRQRGQQLKDPAQLDGWSRDGSAAYLDSICSW